MAQDFVELVDIVGLFFTTVTRFSVLLLVLRRWMLVAQRVVSQAC